MGKLLEIKKMMRLNECRKVEDVEIKVGVLNFSTGNVDRYNFVVRYVKKIPYGSSAWEDDYPCHVVLAYGKVTYDSGKSYNVCYKLTYTMDEELEKLIEPINNGIIIKDIHESIKMYN